MVVVLLAFFGFNNFGPPSWLRAAFILDTWGRDYSITVVNGSFGKDPDE